MFLPINCSPAGDEAIGWLDQEDPGEEAEDEEKGENPEFHFLEDVFLVRDGCFSYERTKKTELEASRSVRRSK